MSETLLSICIPTFNREAYLRRLLDTLLPAVERHRSKVSLLVLDNASSDGTAALCQAYIQAGKPLRYQCNDRNLGPDANVIQSFERVDSVYGWILGDDEYVYEQTLDTVIETLEREELSLLYLKSETCTETRLADRKPRNQGIDHFSSSADFARPIGVYFTFISALVFNKRQLLQDPDFAGSIRQGTWIGQMAWILPLLRQGRRFASSQACLIAAEPNNSSGGYRLVEVFGVNLRAQLDAFLPGEARLKRLILHSAMWFLASFCSGGQADAGAENPISALDQAFHDLPAYRLLVRPLLMYRSVASRMCVKVICRFRKSALQLA
ncbi:glycosyltransferase family 2 protein [Chromobacterium sp. ATCC 53434]|uniref:glycosyltransferase family 2 protein n=1 Tax=Chromobacterium sp. (strain ATCC 53434 / SC 14030) TaxID=2059672 RepID=UPI0013051F0E|nr:glycosyltransferase family 2 protein [Chromobacterium sp. ATCC 53434]